MLASLKSNQTLSPLVAMLAEQTHSASAAWLHLPRSLGDWLLLFGALALISSGALAILSRLFVLEVDPPPAERPTPFKFQARLPGRTAPSPTPKAPLPKPLLKRFSFPGKVALALAAVSFALSLALFGIKAVDDAAKAERQKAALAEELLWRQRSEDLSTSISARVDEQLTTARRTFDRMLAGFTDQQNRAIATLQAIDASRRAQSDADAAQRLRDLQIASNVREGTEVNLDKTQSVLVDVQRALQPTGEIVVYSEWELLDRDDGLGARYRARVRELAAEDNHFRDRVYEIKKDTPYWPSKADFPPGDDDDGPYFAARSLDASELNVTFATEDDVARLKSGVGPDGADADVGPYGDYSDIGFRIPIQQVIWRQSDEELIFRFQGSSSVDDKVVDKKIRRTGRIVSIPDFEKSYIAIGIETSHLLEGYLELSHVRIEAAGREYEFDRSDFVPAMRGAYMVLCHPIGPDSGTEYRARAEAERLKREAAAKAPPSAEPELSESGFPRFRPIPIGTKPGCS